MKTMDKGTQACAAWPIQAAAAGDDAAFTEIVRRMRPLMQSLVRVFTHIGVDAEDLAQESLLGLLFAIRTYRPEGGAQFTTYACTCMRNRLVSLARREGCQGIRQPLEEDTQAPDNGEADPASRVQAQEAAARLYEQLRQRLTPLEYQVLLARLDHRPYREIAASLGVSEKAVDNAVQRLRHKMSQAI